MARWTEAFQIHKIEADRNEEFRSVICFDYEIAEAVASRALMRGEKEKLAAGGKLPAREGDDGKNSPEPT